MKKVYRAVTEEQGFEELENFAQKWDNKYLMISKSWKNNWNNLSEFYNYPEYIRKAIYTTNAIESLNSSFRKVIKKRSTFPTDDAIYKVLYIGFDEC